MRGAVLELRYQREVRVEAPCPRVHEEVSDLAQLLAYLPRAENVKVGESGRHGSLRATLLDGRLGEGEPLDVVTELVELPLNAGIDLLIEAPALELRGQATFDLIPAAEDETQLRCGVTLTCTHRKADRFRSRLIGVLESRVDIVTQDLADRVGRSAKAERVFTEVDRAPDPFSDGGHVAERNR